MEDRQTDGPNYKLSKLTEMLPIFSTKGANCFQEFLMFSFSITVPLDSEEETPLGQREEGKDNLEQEHIQIWVLVGREQGIQMRYYMTTLIQAGFGINPNTTRNVDPSIDP